MRGAVVGSLTAIGLLIVLGLGAGFATSLPGVLIASALSFMAGTGTAAFFDRRLTRNAGIVGGCIVVLVVAYLLMLQMLMEPGLQGGPNQPLPESPRNPNH